MGYIVKEIFYTLQGEGANCGRRAVFCRFAGCNLWSGREEDRASAIRRLCDTDFVGTDGSFGGKYDRASQLADRVLACWTARTGRRLFCSPRNHETGMTVDLAVLRHAIDEVKHKLDHRFLDEVPELRAPTLENLGAFVLQGMAREAWTVVRVEISRPASGDSCVVSS